VRSRWAAAAAVAVAAALALAFAGRAPAPGGDADVAAIAAMVAGGARQVALRGVSARGSVIVGESGRRTAFVVEGLPAPPPSRGYQVWVRGAATRSPGMLRRTAGGLEILVVRGDLLAGSRHVGITIEPAAGSPARTGAVQVAGDVI
jgi:hypothetical protein